MKRRGLIRVGVAIAVAVALWWLALAGGPREDAPIRVESASSESPAGTRRAAAGAPAAVRAAMSNAEPTATPDPPLPELAATATDPEPRAPLPAVIPPETRGFVDALAARFETDPRDSSAHEVEAKLRSLFRDPEAPSGLLQSVLCREAVCRLDVHWTPQSDPFYRRMLATLIGDNAKVVATRAAEPDDHGAVRVELFWLRALGRLPD